MAVLDRVTADPNVMNGQPCIRGMRLTVRRVLSLLAQNPDRDALRADYPELVDEDFRQTLEYAGYSHASLASCHRSWRPAA